MSKAADLKTIILRFRDLVCDDTIGRHDAIIQEKGYVWWGWWAKPQETIPPAAFTKISQQISQEGKLDIYLFDSGNCNIFSVTCSDIKYGADSKPINTPESEYTPEYYNKNPCRAWFKLSDIKPSDEAVIVGFSYVDLDEFFISDSSPFKVFDNKCVFSLVELQEQQRTIWFIRPRSKDDKGHEIKSYSSKLSDVSSVDPNYKSLSTESILWLSDTHFSEDHHAFKSCKTEDRSLSSALKENIGRLESIMSPSAMIISGDLVYAAQEHEYELASRFMKDIKSNFSIEEPYMAICPGNHDFSFSADPNDPMREVSIVYDTAKEKYETFHRRLFGYKPNEYAFSIRRFISYYGTPIEIICMNTSYLQQIEHAFQGMGFSGSPQRTAIRAELKKTDSQKPLRILVMHHHLVPVMYSEEPKPNKSYSLALDSEAIQQFASEADIKVVLHGHCHKEYYGELIRLSKEKIKKKIYIIGLGSSGVEKKSLADGRQNMFSIIKTLEDRLEIIVYSLLPHGESGEELFKYIIPMKEVV